MSTDSELQAHVQVQRGELLRALAFLQRSRTRTALASLSFDGRSILLDCGRWKSEFAATGHWDLLVTVGRGRLLEVLRRRKVLPETIDIVVGDSRLKIDLWWFDAESVTTRAGIRIGALADNHGRRADQQLTPMAPANGEWTPGLGSAPSSEG